MGTRHGEKAARACRSEQWGGSSLFSPRLSFCNCESTSCIGEWLPGGGSKVAPCVGWMALDWMNVGNWFPPCPEGGRRLAVPRRYVFLSPPPGVALGLVCSEKSPGSLSCFPVLLVLPQSERGGSGVGLRVGICRGWEGVCGTAKTSFSDLEGWVTGAVCMLLAGPLPSGVTHSCERVAACRAAACHAWLGFGQAGSLQGERCCPPPAHWGLRGRRCRAQGVSGRNPL